MTVQRLKVLHIISGDLWAGAEAQTFSLITQLAASPDLELHAAVLNQGTLASRLSDIPIPVYEVNEKKFGSAGITRKLAEIIRQQQIDIVHTHRFKENILGCIAARWVGRPRLIKTVHGLPEPFSLLRRSKAAILYVVDRILTRRYFDRVICVSREIASGLTPLLGAERVVTIHNGVDIDACKPKTGRENIRHEFGVPPGVPLIGTIGRLVPVKGLDSLLHAVSSLRRAGVDLRLIMVGDGREDRPLKQLSSELDIVDCVTFAGFRSNALDILAALDVLVMPSLSEGVPIVLLEAMALRVPVVATHVGGMAEILEDGRTALLVSPRDAESLAGAIKHLLANPSLAASLALKASQQVQEQHSAAHMAESVAALYRSLISQ